MKVVLSSLSDVPEALRGEYEERDGKYVLKIEGDVPGLVSASELEEANRKLIEFRDNNRGLNDRLKELDELKRRYDGVDVDEHKKLKARIAELEKQGMNGDTNLSEIVQQRIAEHVKPLQEQLEELTEREKSAKAELARKELESILTQEGINAGIAEKAIPDYLRRGRETWRYEDGKPVAYRGDQKVYSEKKLDEPMSPREWVTKLASDAPHLFKSSSGGGASGGSNSAPGGLTYDPNDDKDFLANLDEIAKGKAVPRGV